MWSTEQDTSNLKKQKPYQSKFVRFESSIPELGSKENPQVIESSQYIDLVNPEFIGQSRANHLGEYSMVFKSNDRYFKTNNKVY